MARRILSGMTLAVVGVFLAIAGCVPKTELALKFAPDDTASYTVTSTRVKNFKFEMPSSNKFNEDISETVFAVTFDQTIESVDEAGVATANITFQGLKYIITDKGEDKYSFDSEKPADAKAGLGKLIGESYKIKIDPKGKVEVVDAASIRGIVKGGVAASKAKSFLSDKAIVSRHEVVTLGVLEQPETAAGKWSVVKKTPYRLLVDRTFEKIYQLGRGDKPNVAVVTMEAIPAEKSEKGAINPAMLMFGDNMDVDEKFTGKTEFNVETGKMLSYDETLWVRYITIDASREGAEPDVLTITLEFSQKAELVK